MKDRIVVRVARVCAATALLVASGAGASVAIGALRANPAGAATTTYYVAMGDSLGAGTGASPGSDSYVNRTYQHELARTPGLVLENFSCGGATTASVINGPNCGSPTTQLASAVAFLHAHPGQVAFATIDIGANDVDGCSNGTTIDQTCLAHGLAAVNTNLPAILSALKGAYSGIRIFGMNYYDPFLATWLTGASGQALARQSVPDADAFNSILAAKYAAAGFATADPATRFQTDDFALTGSYNGQTEPQNVADICNWTHMCERGDIHANNTGHAVLAQSFEVLIDSPDAPTAVTAAPGSGAAAIHWAAPAHTGGSPITGYVVTPFVGTVAQSPRSSPSTATVATIAGLTNGQTYTFAVAARNALGTGPRSARSAAVTVGAPAPPTAVQAVSGSTTLATGPLTVTFVAGVNHGAPITGFDATCTSNTGGVTRSGAHTGPAAAPITVTGATTAKSYVCTVTATNSRGTSPASAASSAFTLGAPRAPAPPTVSRTGSGSIAVAFAAPATDGAPISGYTATCASTNGGASRSKSAATGPLTVTGLTAGRSYRCTVAAANSRGSGPASPPSAALVA